MSSSWSWRQEKEDLVKTNIKSITAVQTNKCMDCFFKVSKKLDFTTEPICFSKLEPVVEQYSKIFLLDCDLKKKGGQRTSVGSESHWRCAENNTLRFAIVKAQKSFVQATALIYSFSSGSCVFGSQRETKAANCQHKNEKMILSFLITT